MTCNDAHPGVTCTARRPGRTPCTGRACSAPCGTYAAAMRHQRRGEPKDRACLDAIARYMAALRSRNPEIGKRNRWLVNTRRRALDRLGEEYPQRLSELLARERATGSPW